MICKQIDTFIHKKAFRKEIKIQKHKKMKKIQGKHHNCGVGRF